MNWARRAWSEEAARALEPALGADLTEIGAEVANGRAELFQSPEAWVVTRVEGNELVIVAYSGSRLAEAARDFIIAGQRAGLASMRFHTSNPAMARFHQRLIARYRAVPIEFVSRVQLNGLAVKNGVE